MSDWKTKLYTDIEREYVSNSLDDSGKIIQFIKNHFDILVEPITRFNVSNIEDLEGWTYFSIRNRQLSVKIELDKNEIVLYKGNDSGLSDIGQILFGNGKTIGRLTEEDRIIGKQLDYYVDSDFVDKLFQKAFSI